MSKLCPVSKRCGGCFNIDLAYPKQLKNKQELIQNLYPKIVVEPIIGMENPSHYRHKVYATFGYNHKGRVISGMYAENSHRLIFTKNCYIQHVLANQIIESICQLADKMRIAIYNEDTGYGVLRHVYIRVSEKSNRALVVLVIGSKVLPGSNQFIKSLLSIHPEIETIVLNWNARKTSMILGEKDKILYGKGSIVDEIDSIRFRISPKSFYQVNPIQTKKLYQTAISLAKLKGDENVLDACCGIGTISLLLAKHCKHVTGVEVIKEAIQDAKFNAQINQIHNIRFYCDDVEKFIQHTKEEYDVIFLDPPRSGFSSSFMNTIAKHGAKKIVYISCNPVTQVRDLKHLYKAHYRLDRVIPVDMFPHTKHVECIALLEKR